MTFTPQIGDLYSTMALCVLATLGLIFLAFRFNKIQSSDPRQKVLLPMLAYFLSLLTLMGFLGSLWSVFKYPTVEITGTHILIDGERFPRPKQHEVRLETNESSGLGPSTRVLLVQTKDRRTWAFPEDRYAVNAMMTALR